MTVPDRDTKLHDELRGYAAFARVRETALAKMIHAMIRVLDLDRSLNFYRDAFGLDIFQKLDFPDFALAYLRNPENDFELELTLNKGRAEAYTHGTGYGHVAYAVDDLAATLAQLKEQGIEPEREPYRVREGGSLLCFVRDPDDYRIELIDRSGK